MALFEAHNLHALRRSRGAGERLAGVRGRTPIRHHGPERRRQDHCFNVLTGRYKPDRGRVLLDGATSPADRRRRLRGSASRSFQVMSLFDEFTVFENVAIALPPCARAAAMPSARPTPIRSSPRPTTCSTKWASPADDERQGTALWRPPRAGDRRGSPPGPSSCSSTSRPQGSAAMAARGSPS